MSPRFRSFALTLLSICCLVWVWGCISFRMIREVDGNDVPPLAKQLKVGATDLRQALEICGAPSRVIELGGKNLLIYEQTEFNQNNISVGIPLSDFSGKSIDISAYGNLTRYNTLALFFTPDNILYDVVYEVGSDHPYLKTLLK